ncbi:hypothetical protein PBRA_000029, partial [Plasmodiophora brassicae]
LDRRDWGPRAFAAGRGRMASLYGLGCRDGITEYMQTKRRKYSRAAWEGVKRDLRESATIYVGNLSFYTTEEQIYEMFHLVGPVKAVIMGLNAHTREPCGFAFIEFYTHEHARDAVNYLSGLRLDSRPVKIDIDQGFAEGRQFGRGRAGGQVRDEFREDYDYGRGGWGVIRQLQIEREGNSEPIIHRPRPSSTAEFASNERFRHAESDED